jgi:hypothetical protein
MIWPFRRRRPTEDPEATLAAQARRLGETADRVAAEVAGLVERERAVGERERRLDERLERDAHVLDERRDELAALARDLVERQRGVEELDRRAGELDGREQRLASREEELHAREARLLADELAVRRRSDELDLREEALAALPQPPSSGPRSEPDRCLLFVPQADGYRLLSIDIAPPAPGERLELEGEPFSVVRLGPSPLPGDHRRCAYLAA